MNVKIYVASAFCKNGNGGNLAGVVPDGSGLSVLQKKQIAGELGYSETAFLTKSQIADYKIEYFTPVEEVPLCGHATIASFSVLFLTGSVGQGKYTIETKAGLLTVAVHADGLIMMEQNLPDFSDILEPEALTCCAGSAVINPQLPIQIVSTGLRDILLPVKSPDELAVLNPDFPAMSDLSQHLDVIGVHAFALTGGPEFDAICRNFAPLYGIDEESATGTSNCALACYLYRHFQKKTRYVFEQGYSLGLPSRIIVELDVTEDEFRHVYVGGYGYLVEERKLPFLQVLHAEQEWQRAGAYSVRIQGMNRQHSISLREEFDDYDGDGTRYIVLLDDGYPVATCRFYDLEPGCVMLGRVVVLPEYRGRKLGTQVLKEAESWIRDLGYQAIALESRVEVVDFYQKLGYQIVDGTVVKSGCFDCIDMRKVL